MEHLNVGFQVKQILEDQDDGFFRFEGLASTFGNIDLTDDIIEKGAFIESLAQLLPKVLWQHYSDEPIGMPEIIAENEEGLFLRAKLPIEDTLVSGRVMPQVKVGSIDSMSIGFNIPAGGSETREDGIRVIRKINLKEVSLVTFPANPEARVSGFKSKKDQIIYCIEQVKGMSVRDIEKALRESELFSKEAATFLAGNLKQSESAPEGESAIGDLLASINKHLPAENDFSTLLKKADSYGC